MGTTSEKIGALLALAAIIFIPYLGARFGIFDSLPDTPEWWSLVLPVLFSLLAFQWADTFRKKLLVSLATTISGFALAYGLVTGSSGWVLNLVALGALSVSMGVGISGMIRGSNRTTKDSN